MNKNVGLNLLDLDIKLYEVAYFSLEMKKTCAKLGPLIKLSQKHLTRHFAKSVLSVAVFFFASLVCRSFWSCGWTATRCRQAWVAALACAAWQCVRLLCVGLYIQFRF
jgi:hypothetical protein